MTIKFRKVEEWFSFYDSQGHSIDRKTEVRFDPLTGESSRLIFDPGSAFTPPDYHEIAEQTGGSKCPFCHENVLKITPVFPTEIAEQGRIFQGDAVVFPNLFPYCKHNGVVIFSCQRHYIRLEEFTTSMIVNAFTAAQTYIQKVAAIDTKARYASINWNYLPASGGSMLHPHIQVVVSDSPTNYQNVVHEKAEVFEKESGQNYFTALYETEKSLGERWIGEYGNTAWMHAFAPKGHNDFLAIFPQAFSVNDLTEQDWVNYAKGLKSIFSTLTEQGLASFNLALHLAVEPGANQPIHVRLIPRFTIGLLGTSDMSYFQALHQEPLSYKIPEEVAAKTRLYFGKA